MPDIIQLIEATDEFFIKHWDKNHQKKPPKWKYNWDWSSSVPYHNKGGVYALFDQDSELIYIGIGASIGSKQYKEHGISRRLLAHVIKRSSSKTQKYIP